MTDDDNASMTPDEQPFVRRIGAHEDSEPVDVWPESGVKESADDEPVGGDSDDAEDQPVSEDAEERSMADDADIQPAGEDAEPDAEEAPVFDAGFSEAARKLREAVAGQTSADAGTWTEEPESPEAPGSPQEPEPSEQVLIASDDAGEPQDEAVSAETPQAWNTADAGSDAGSAEPLVEAPESELPTAAGLSPEQPLAQDLPDQQPSAEPLLAEEIPEKKSFFSWLKRKKKTEETPEVAAAPEAPAVDAQSFAPAQPEVVAPEAGLTGAIEGLSSEAPAAGAPAPEAPAPEAPALEAPAPGAPAPAPEPAPEPESIFSWLEPELAPAELDAGVPGEESLFPLMPGGPVEEPAAAAPVPPGSTDLTTVLPPLPDASAGQTAVLPAVTSEALGVDMGPERKRGWWVWVLVGLAIACVLGGAAYAWWWSTSRPITVPDIVGKRPAEATQKINDIGLVLGKVSEVPTDAAPVGTIIRQTPKKGADLTPGGTVSFVVAASPEQAEVPNVVGLTADDAGRLLAENRLRPFVVESNNATVPPGTVIAQLPASASEMPPGSQVVIAVSKGLATQPTMPDTKGMQISDAVYLLEARGFSVKKYSCPASGTPVDRVIDQASNIGEWGAVAMLLVSSGQPGSGLKTVPLVAGLTKAEAESKLKDRGLTAEVTNVPSSNIAKGKVIAQLAAQNAKVPSGAVIGLLVSTGSPTSAVVPSLVGTLSADATKSASAAGFKPVEVQLPIASGVVGHVFAQYPLPGTTYSRGYPLIYVVPKPLTQ